MLERATNIAMGAAEIDAATEFEELATVREHAPTWVGPLPDSSACARVTAGPADTVTGGSQCVYSMQYAVIT